MIFYLPQELRLSSTGHFMEGKSYGLFVHMLISTVLELFTGRILPPARERGWR